jgi:hypothetical protein
VRPTIDYDDIQEAAAGKEGHNFSAEVADFAALAPAGDL